MCYSLFDLFMRSIYNRGDIWYTLGFLYTYNVFNKPSALKVIACFKKENYGLARPKFSNLLHENVARKRLWFLDLSSTWITSTPYQQHNGNHEISDILFTRNRHNADILRLCADWIDPSIRFVEDNQSKWIWRGCYQNFAGNPPWMCKE